MISEIPMPLGDQILYTFITIDFLNLPDYYVFYLKMIETE